MNSLKLKASRDLVYNAIAKYRGYVYNSDREVFVANRYGSYDTVLIGKTVDGQYTFIDYFDSVMTLAREKY